MTASCFPCMYMCGCVYVGVYVRVWVFVCVCVCDSPGLTASVNPVQFLGSVWCNTFRESTKSPLQDRINKHMVLKKTLHPEKPHPISFPAIACLILMKSCLGHRLNKNGFKYNLHCSNTFDPGLVDSQSEDFNVLDFMLVLMG